MFIIIVVFFYLLRNLSNTDMTVLASEIGNLTKLVNL